MHNNVSGYSCTKLKILTSTLSHPTSVLPSLGVHRPLFHQGGLGFFKDSNNLVKRKAKEYINQEKIDKALLEDPPSFCLTVVKVMGEKSTATGHHYSSEVLS